MKVALLVAALLASGCALDPASTSDATKDGGGPCDGAPTRFISCVVDFEPGEGAGWGQKDYPDVIYGSPEGAGLSQGDTDSVLSLGKGGSIVVGFGENEIVDGDGADLLVFENAFEINGTMKTFAEPAEVSVSEDGVAWSTFACDPSTLAGCAGVKPVLASSTNGVSALDPRVAGGDAFDLHDLGLAKARYVRLVDRSSLNAAGSTSAGFDLDAMAIVNAATP